LLLRIEESGNSREAGRLGGQDDAGGFALATVAAFDLGAGASLSYSLPGNIAR
jgi:hypothetical protein